jgi:hypothetical protein
MARTPCARTVALRDQIVAILRAEHPLPIATMEILKRMANEGRNCGTDYNNPDLTCVSNHWPPAECAGWCWHARVYSQLRAMVRLELVEHLSVPDMRCVYWRYVPTADDTAANALLDSLEDV